MAAIAVATTAVSEIAYGAVKDDNDHAADAKSGTTFTDNRDGKVYRTVAIGTQTWMAENLNFAAEGSKCYENKDANCAKYGRLYSWETARKACPAGFHLPSDDEWAALENSVGRRTMAGAKLKSSSGWANNGNGTDEYGFSALPGGYVSGGEFSHAGIYGYWWSATEYTANYAWIRYMYYNYDDVYKRNSGKAGMYSVRCVQN